MLFDGQASATEKCATPLIGVTIIKNVRRKRSQLQWIEYRVGDVIVVRTSEDDLDFARICSFVESENEHCLASCVRLMPVQWLENVMAYRIEIASQCVINLGSIHTYLPMGVYEMLGLTYLVPPTYRHLPHLN